MDEPSLGFCVKRIERLSNSEYSITISTISGKEFSGTALIKKTKLDGRTMNVVEFTSKNIQDSMNNGEIIARPIVDLLNRMDRMVWTQQPSSQH